MTKTRILILTGILASAAGFLLLETGLSADNNGPMPPAPPELKKKPAGKPAPDFVLRDQNGVEVNLHQFKGKYIHLDFSAVWCGYCRRQASYLGALEKELAPKGFVHITVIVGNRPKDVKAWAERYNLRRVLLDADNVARSKYKTRHFPSNYVLRPDLTVAGKWLGAHRNAAVFKRQLRRLVPELFKSAAPIH